MLMNRTFTLMCIVIAGALLSAGGLILVPHYQLSGLQPFETDPTMGTVYPDPAIPQDAVVYGRRDYLSLGCATCHSQAVRRPGFGADHARGWGDRQTVARDYLGEQIPVVGWQRIGPDLANIGERKPAPSWHLAHLYAPQAISPGSTMPPYRFLFETIELAPGELPPDNALQLPPGTVADTLAVIPTRRAHNLVAYLTSLDRSTPLPEAPMAVTE